MVYKKYHQDQRFAETEAQKKHFAYRNWIHKSWILFWNNELKTFSILWDTRVEMRAPAKKMLLMWGGGRGWGF